MSHYLPEAEDQGSAKRANEEGAAHNQEPLATCLLRVGGAEFGPPNSNSNDGKKKSKYENCLEWLRSNKTAIETLGLFVLIAYTSAAFWQGREAKRSADAATIAADAAQSAADTAAAGLRPWLKINEVSLRHGSDAIPTLGFHWPLTGAPIPPMLQIKVSLDNVGHSVAQNIVPWPRLFFSTFSADGWEGRIVTAESRVCDGITSIVVPTGGRSAFPGDPIVFDMGASGLIPNRINAPAAELIVCVNYTGLGGKHFQTQARFGLYEDNSVYVYNGRDAQADRLRLIRDPAGDHAK